MSETVEVRNIKINITTNVKGTEKVKDMRSNLKEATAASSEAKTEIGEIEKPMSKLGKTAGGLGRRFRDWCKSLAETRTHATKTASRLGIFFNQLKRIATYRLIRSALKAIVSSFKEGIQNLYQWSLLNDQTFSKSMDDLATSVLYLKNALGTALAPIITGVVVPAIHAIVDAVVDAINWINQLIAVVQGKTTYTRAIRQTTQFAAATAGAAKEVRRMLLGFDEINRLEAPSSGGGGSSANYNNMFENATVGTDFLNSFGGTVAINLKDILFKWDNLSTADILKKIVFGLSTVAGGVIGFSIGGLGGAVIGIVIGAAIGLSLVSMMDSTGKKLSKDEIFTHLKWGLAQALAAGLVGLGLAALVVGPGAALIGLAVGVALSLIIQSIAWKKDPAVEAANQLLDEVVKNQDTGWVNLSVKEKNTNVKIKGATIGGAFASGGYPAVGSAFIAGEAGPEFVGTIGGRTGVVNSTQMADAVAEGNSPVVTAIAQATMVLAQALERLPAPVVNIGDKQVYRSAERGKRVAGSNFVSVT